MSAVGQLFSVVSHELNNPLAVIMGYTDLAKLRLSAAIGDYIGSGGRIPMDVRRSGTTFSLAATVDLEEVFQGLDDTARSAQLRLRLVWENSSWEKTLSRPRKMEPTYEVSFSGTGQLALNRGKAAPR